MKSRDLTIVVLVLLSAFVLLPVLVMTTWGWGMIGPGMWGGGAVGLIWLVVLAAIIVALLQRKDLDLGRWFSGQAGKSPLDIAKERYARGEISREEFEQLRKDLEASNTHAHEADSHGGHSHGHCGH